MHLLKETPAWTYRSRTTNQWSRVHVLQNNEKQLQYSVLLLSHQARVMIRGIVSCTGFFPHGRKQTEQPTPRFARPAILQSRTSCMYKTSICQLGFKCPSHQALQDLAPFCAVFGGVSPGFHPLWMETSKRSGHPFFCVSFATFSPATALV